MIEKHGFRCPVQVYTRDCESAQNPIMPTETCFDGQIGLPDSSGLKPAPSQNCDELGFDSAFEGGNLQSAVRVGANTYELFLTPDRKTGCTQWFYFSITNMKKGNIYHLKILNMTKQESLFTSGQQPLIFSSILCRKEGRSWFRAGSDIKYTKSARKRDGPALYTLSFNLDFSHGHDQCFLAYCYPYTYTDLQKYLRKFKVSVENSRRVEVQTLCRSKLGKEIPIITITAPSQNGDERKKKGIFLSSRVHPGESNASWVTQGFIEFLVSDCEEAHNLLSNYIFRIVPMLNPDGCSHGTYRCDELGFDLNRHWSDPDQELHPSIFYTKKVEFFFDVHGHSARYNSFFYGCDGKQSSAKTGEDADEQCFPAESSEEKLIAHMLQNRCSAFSLRDSMFSVTKEKVNTGRVVAWRDMGIIKSYTMEVSLAGTGDENGLISHFSSSDLQNIGRSLGIALNIYCLWSHSKQAFDPDYLCLPAISSKGDMMETTSKAIQIMCQSGALKGAIPSQKASVGSSDAMKKEEAAEESLASIEKCSLMHWNNPEGQLERQIRGGRTCKLHLSLSTITYGSQQNPSSHPYSIRKEDQNSMKKCKSDSASIPVSLNKRDWNLWSVISRFQQLEARRSGGQSDHRHRNGNEVSDETSAQLARKRLRNQNLKISKDPSLCIKTIEFGGHIENITLNVDGESARGARHIAEDDQVELPAISHDWASRAQMPPLLLNGSMKAKAVGPLMSPLASSGQQMPQKCMGMSFSEVGTDVTSPKAPSGLEKLPLIGSTGNTFSTKPKCRRHMSEVGSGTSSSGSPESRSCRLTELDWQERPKLLSKRPPLCDPSRKFFSPRALDENFSNRQKRDPHKKIDYEGKAVGRAVKYLPFMLGKPDRPVIG